jgi:hypothetical protein
VTLVRFWLRAFFDQEATLKTIYVIFLGLFLAGCAASEPFIANEDSAAGHIEDLLRPGQRKLARQAAYDTRCREYGFKPGTEGYGNCRLKLEQIRATERSGRVRSDYTSESSLNGNKIYDASECTGPVIMGRCEGATISNKAYHPTCHGTWLNGQCTGPMF